MIRDVATEGEGGSMGAMLPSPTSISKPSKQGPEISISNIRDIAFYRCSEIVRTRNFTIFTVYATVFGNRSLHAGPSEKVRYLPLDLLKSFFLNERLNLRL